MVEDEKKQTETTPTTPTVPNENSNNGVSTEGLEQNKTPGTSPLEQYKAENDRREKLLNEQKELIKKQEELMTNQMLMGKSQAGQTPEPPKEKSDHEYRLEIDEKLSKGEFDD